MKLRTLLFIAFLIITAGLKAQVADQLIGGLLSQSDWFTLNEVYPKEKENIQSPMLKELAEVMLATSFNEPEKALIGINSLLTNHQESLGFSNVCNMVALKSSILGEQGDYAQSADNMNNFLDQIKSLVDMSNFQSYEEMAKMYNDIRIEPKPKISRPDKDVEILMYIEKAGKGTLMFVLVTIKGKEYRFIFDTGASRSFVSKRFADEIGLRVISDSVTVTGIEVGMGENGTIDSMQVGELIFRHPIIMIAPSDPKIDTIYQTDAVLGLDFIKRVGEIQFFPKERKIVFPKNQTSLPQTGRNLLQQNGQSYIKVLSGSERLVMHFDTGNSNAALFDTYYNKHKEQVSSVGVKDTIHTGGYGGIRKLDVYTIPNIGLSVGSTNFEMKNMLVQTSKGGENQYTEDGSLGMSFIHLFEKVTINYDKMFVEID